MILRGLKASQSALIFENSFKDSKQTEEEIDKQVDRLLDLGYDSVIISAIKVVIRSLEEENLIPINN